MEQPTKRGDKFTVDYSNEIYSVANFFGSSGLSYETAKEAAEKNPNDEWICINNLEYGGAHDIRGCKLI